MFGQLGMTVLCGEHAEGRNRGLCSNKNRIGKNYSEMQRTNTCILKLGNNEVYNTEKKVGVLWKRQTTE